MKYPGYYGGMKKKGLNQRQLARIRDTQEARVARSGSDTNPGTALPGTERRGLVISHFGQQLDIEALDGEDSGTVYRCFQRSNIAALVTGDEVIWQAGEPSGVVLAGLSRRTLLTRPNNFGELKPVAANIDSLLIVIAAQPEPHYNLIDRYLVAAVHSGLQPLLLLNKCDLPQASDAGLQELLLLYRRLDYPVLEVSGKAGTGLPALRQLLATRTSIFVGQSGVGKSALVNALLPGVNTLEGSLSEAVLKGRHTTTAARLFHFPEGGNLIDSPGIREFGLWHIGPEQLLQGFVEFHPYLGGCRFRDCRHEEEPDCRLQEAVKAGRIDPRRLASYQSIRTTLKPGGASPG